MVANAAAAAAAAGIGPAGDANEQVRSLRLRQAIMGDTVGAAVSTAAGTSDTKTVDSPSNSFSRYCKSHLLDMFLLRITPWWLHYLNILEAVTKLLMDWTGVCSQRWQVCAAQGLWCL